MGLSVPETSKTLDFVRGIKDAGKSCIFIDHNIFNVHQVVERVVVIDRGRPPASSGRRRSASPI